MTPVDRTGTRTEPGPQARLGPVWHLTDQDTALKRVERLVAAPPGRRR